jgi:GTP-binding protein
MFCDEAQVRLIAGKGGDGCIGFRREKFIPRGGPNGGDGGVGGSVYLEANENINTLAEFNTHKTFKAKSGEKGKGKDMGGLDAEDLILQVPVGTTIFDENKKHVLGDLTSHGDRFEIARGGRGGFGNAHFKSSTRQAPMFAELGEPGEQRTCVLELKLVADVGIIGLPSVGKSTLLSRISNARPKIAAYHFTTLIPNLGLVTMQQFGGSIQQSFLACDLPGLIEGAHEGKGLGIQFLKHVARNRVLVHLLDANSEDPSKDYETIMNEMKLFDKKLPKKPQIVAFNKIDTRSPEEMEQMIATFKKTYPKIKEVLTFSGVTGEGLKPLMFKIWNVLEKEKAKVAVPIKPKEEFKIFRPHLETDDKHFEVRRLSKLKRGNMFQVIGRRIEQIVIMSDFDNPEAISRIYDVIQKMGINKELHRAGARFGDEIKIGNKIIIYKW